MLALAVAGPLQASTAERVELLALRLNGVEPAGAPGVVAVRRGADGLALDRATWAALGLREPAAGSAGPWLALDAAALAWRIDTPSQTLLIDAPASAFRGGALAFDGPAGVTPAQGRGVFANYEAHWQAAGAGLAARGGAWLELNGFGPAGTWHHGVLVQHDERGTRALRLETRWRHEDTARQRSLELGDTLLHGGSWGRTLRIGGLRWSHDFSLTPGFVSFPTPTLLGEVTLPSTVELYIDGVRRLAQGVAAGPFEIGGLPLPTGQGELRLVVRDLLGRERVLLMPYHTHAALLKPGLVAHSVEIGAERLDHGRASGHYGRPVAAATHREGLSERWTQEWRVEAGPSHLAAGSASTWLWPGLATVQGQMVVSASAGQIGHMLALQTEHAWHDASLSLQARAHSAGFRQLGQGREPAPQWQASAHVGTRWAGLGVALNLLHRQSRTGAAQQLAGAQLSHPLGPWGQLGLTLLHDRGAGTVAALNLLVPLGPRQSLSAGWTHRRSADGGRAQGGQLWWQQTPHDEPDAGPGLGLRLGLEQPAWDAAPKRASGELLWLGQQVELEAGVARWGPRTLTRLGARGAVGLVDGHAFVGRRIDGSVAVVQVEGAPGVAVLLDRRPVGHTGADGRLVVSGLRPHERQRIELDADALPADAEARDLVRDIVVPGRGGFTLALPLHRAHAVQLQLRLADGGVPAPGSRIEVAGRAAEPGDVVGFEGRVFLARLEPGTPLQLTVLGPGGPLCRLSLQMPAGGTTDLGAQPCR